MFIESHYTLKKTWKDYVKVFFHDDCASQDSTNRNRRVKVIRDPPGPLHQNPECNMKMPLIKSPWNQTNPEFEVASSISSLRLFSILPNLHTCSFVCSGWELFLLSFPSSVENSSWTFVFDWRPLWSSLKTQNCHKPCSESCEVDSVLCKIKSATKDALSCTSWTLFCVIYVHIL